MARSQRPQHRVKTSDTVVLYGRHAVEAAVRNPVREIVALWATRNAARALSELIAQARPGLAEALAETSPDDLSGRLPKDAVHQGLLAEVRPLAPVSLETIGGLAGASLVVVLDQVTDPHNVGAVLRSAAAFGAKALVTTDRHAPPESGALAKAASGALEVVPWARVANLARALDTLADAGYWRIGLDGGAERVLAEVDLGDRLALVLGAEGKGLRAGTAKHCDVLARLPITAAVDSLNVSNAAAVALYELTARSG